MRNSETHDGRESALPDMHLVNDNPSRGEHTTASRSTSRPADEQDLSLFSAAQAGSFRGQWGDLQARFVDDPQGAVSGADQLLAEVLNALTSNFAEQKRSLEASWASGGERDTEQLRRTLQRYRMFFHQLVDA